MFKGSFVTMAEVIALHLSLPRQSEPAEDRLDSSPAERTGSTPRISGTVIRPSFAQAKLQSLPPR